MTRVIHTGDTHVGYRQYHSPERRRDFLAAFERVVEDAIADDVDAVVHAGDLFHDRRPGLVDLQGVIAALRRLHEADVPFLAVVGNHESKRDGQWLDLFADIGLATRLGRDPVVVGDAAVYGLDFVPPARRTELEYDFSPVPSGTRPVLCAHGLFEPFAHGDWDTERLLTESTVDFEALLLGDNHQPGREEVDDTVLTYCGSTERASATERDDRGYNIVTVPGLDAEGSVSVSRRGLPTREFVFVDLTLAEDEGEARVREALRQHDPEDAVVVVTVEGDGDPITPAGVEEFALDRGALIARMNDRRELDATDRETGVSFADPDEAVRERLAEVGLSEAARDIDRVVRTDGQDLADANVRETVERRVRERLEDEEGDLVGFDPDGDGDVDVDVDPDAGVDTETDGPEPDRDETETSEITETTANASDSATNGDSTGVGEERTKKRDNGQDQASMEDYL
jgi:DNA repair exonuclease SbcCD nuclease subunit